MGDTKTRAWALSKARTLLQKFESDWWYGGDTDSYADSLDDPGNEKVYQRHWIGLTPTDAVLPADLVRTSRGLEVQVPAGRGSGVSEFRVTLR